MYYYHLLMPWLAGFSLFLTLLVFALWVYAGLHIKKLCDLPLSEPGSRLPSVSLIAPARNEERNIEQAVRSLLKLDTRTCKSRSSTTVQPIPPAKSSTAWRRSFLSSTSCI